MLIFSLAILFMLPCKLRALDFSDGAKIQPVAKICLSIFEEEFDKISSGIKRDFPSTRLASKENLIIYAQEILKYWEKSQKYEEQEIIPISGINQKKPNNKSIAIRNFLLHAGWIYNVMSDPFGDWFQLSREQPYFRGLLIYLSLANRDPAQNSVVKAP